MQIKYDKNERLLWMLFCFCLVLELRTYKTGKEVIIPNGLNVYDCLNIYNNTLGLSCAKLSSSWG